MACTLDIPVWYMYGLCPGPLVDMAQSRDGCGSHLRDLLPSPHPGPAHANPGSESLGALVDYTPCPPGNQSFPAWKEEGAWEDEVEYRGWAGADQGEQTDIRQRPDKVSGDEKPRVFPG